MTLTKIRKWTFPVIGNKALSESALYRALAEAKDGFYPLGSNQLWHGGIHINTKVASELKATSIDYLPEVKCMADGEIIAYRLNDKYPLIDYGDKVASYSNGFVLVRHLLQMDYVESPLSIANEFKVISANDSLSGDGVNVRNYPRGEKIGFLLNGTKITLDLDKEYHEKGYYWYPLESIDNGYSSLPRLVKQEIKLPNATEGITKTCLGWVSLGKTQLTNSSQTIEEQNDEVIENSALRKGLAIRANNKSDSEQQSLLPINSIIKLSEFDAEKKWAKVASISADSYSTTPNVQGWVKLSQLQQLPVIEEKDKKNHSIYVYSLYMHLADINHYAHYPKARVPAHFTPNTYKVIKAKLDKIKGQNIRKEPASGAANKKNILGVLQNGTKVNILLDFKEPNKTNWYAVESLCDGYHAIPPLPTFTHTITDTKANTKTEKAILGWIYIKNRTGTSTTYTIKDSDENDLSIGLRVRKEPKSGDKHIVSMLPENCELKIKGRLNLTPAKYIKINAKDIEAGKATLPLKAGNYYVWSESLTLVNEAQPFNQIVVLDTPLAVKSGDLLGHMGHYHGLAQAVDKTKVLDTHNIYEPVSTNKPYTVEPLVHVELFTCDDLPDFIKQTQEEAKKIVDKDKPLLLVDKGAQLYQIKQDAEQLSIAQNVEIEVVAPQDEKWLQVNERYSFKIKASDYGYTLSDVTTTLAVQSDKKADFVKLLQTLTSGDIPLVDIPDTITFTGQYINPTTKTSTTDKAVAIAEKSGYTDIEISLVRKNKTVWVARSEVEKGHRKTLSGSLSGYKTHPLSSVESNDNLVVGHLQLIKPNGQNEFSADEKATDEAGNAWRYITAGSVNNVEIKGWLKTTQDNVKWVSPWQWPGFTQVDEQTTLAEQRLIQIRAQEQETVPETTQASVDAQTTTSKMAEAYQGSVLLTHVSDILKNLSVDGQAQALNDEPLKAALRYPWLAQRFSQTLVKHESEWYSEIDSESKMPKWEALNEQLNGDVKVYLDFLNDESSKSQALALLQQNYTTRYQEQAKITELLAKDEINLSGFESLKRRANGNNKICQDLTTAKSCLETHINAWEQEKARIKASLWWDEVAKKLAAKQAAQTKESEAAKADQQPLPSLSVDGKAWYLHPVGVMRLTINSCTERFHRISKIILKHEGGYVNNPNDSGGATNKGIAWNTWINYAEKDLGIAPTLDNLKALTDSQAEIIYRKRYWQPKGFCDINNERVGLMIYDWTITSGGAVKKIQELLVSEFSKQISINGVMNVKTIDAINSIEDQNSLLERIAQIRKDYYTKLAINTDGSHTKNYVFLRGWLNRVDDCLRVNIND